MRIPFSAWTPDAAVLGRGRLREARNIIPRAEHYEPFYNLVTSGGALDARGRGLAAYKDQAGVAHQYAGDAAKLYERASNGTWSDVSKVGGYTSTESSRWRFAQFGDLCLATNGQDPVQSVAMSGAPGFANLAGSPPVAQFIAAFDNFVFLGNLSSSAFGYRNSAINDATGWVNGVNQASEGEFAKGGEIAGMVSNTTSLFFFQQTMIRRAIYTGGPLIFDIQPIEEERGCAAPGSIASFGQFTFFLAEDGFYQLTDAGAQPIGDGVVDKWFQADSQRDFWYRMSSTIDPFNKLYIVAYPSTSSVSGAPDSLLLYNWAVGRFAYARLPVEVLSSVISLSTTLEDLDAIYGNLDAIPISLDDPLLAGGVLTLGAIGADRKLGSFSGAALEAVFETDDVLGPEGLVQFITGVMPMADAAQAYAAVGARMRSADAVAWSTERAMHPRSGVCPARVNARWARFRLRLPAATQWSKLEALEVSIGLDGEV